MPAPTLSIPDLPGQFARLVPATPYLTPVDNWDGVPGTLERFERFGDEGITCVHAKMVADKLR
jgi:hypothetical protein